LKRFPLPYVKRFEYLEKCYINIKKSFNFLSHSRCINIGPDFQAELPDLIVGREHDERPEEAVREELLWKPWAELEENDTLLQHGNKTKYSNDHKASGFLKHYS